MTTRAGQHIIGFTRALVILIRNARDHATCMDKKKAETARHKPTRRTIVFLEMP